MYGIDERLCMLRYPSMVVQIVCLSKLAFAMVCICEGEGIRPNVHGLMANSLTCTSCV